MNVDVETLSAAIPEWMASESVAGLSLAVVAGGEIAWADGFGVLTKEPATSASIFGF